MRCVPGVADRTIGRVFVGRTHGELVAIELAQSHHAGLAQTRDHGGVKGRAVPAEHARAGGGGQVFGDKHVFVRNRHAFERAGGASGQFGVGFTGLGQGDFAVDVQKRVVRVAAQTG